MIVTPMSIPPTMPATLPKTVSTGIEISMAVSFGNTRNDSGRIPIVSSALICSSSFIVPISAANAEPAQPVSTIATMSGPSSFSTTKPTASTTKISWPSFESWICPLTAMTIPISRQISSTIGSA